MSDDTFPQWSPAYTASFSMTSKFTAADLEKAIAAIAATGFSPGQRLPQPDPEAWMRAGPVLCPPLDTIDWSEVAPRA